MGRIKRGQWRSAKVARIRLAIAVGVLFVCSSAHAQSPDPKSDLDKLLDKRTFTKRKAALPYRLLKPDGYDKNGKDRYPLVPLEDYAGWTREDGMPFDPWVRLHTRLGAETLGLAPRSLDISGSAAEWEAWTGMHFPQDGDYVVPGALVPVTFEGGVGRYVEPNIWMRHEPRPPA